MAEPDTGSGSSFGFLTHKLGPFPVWVWALAIAGGYYWYTHYGPGAGTSTAASGSVNEVDQIVTTPNFGGSQYKTNAEWEAAALNYLVSESVPPDEASTALYKYLHAQSLSAQQEKDVNLAIEGIGPPPTIPAPGKQTSPTQKPPVKRKTPAPKPKPKPKPKPIRRPGPNPGPVSPPGPVIKTPVTREPASAPAKPASAPAKPAPPVTRKTVTRKTVTRPPVRK